MAPVKSFNGKTTAPADEASIHSLKRGTIFLLLEERSTVIYRILRRSLNDNALQGESNEDQRNIQGLIVTRAYPPDLQREHDLGDVPIHWLTTNLRTDMRTIAPTTITKLNQVMTEFLQTPGEGLAVVDCLEYLITQNSFEVVLRLIQTWNDKVVGTKKRLLLSVDPLTLTIQKLHLIKKECLELVS